MVTDRALLGVGDPDRSVMEPARIPGHGSVPAPVARAWLREGLDHPATGPARHSPRLPVAPDHRVTRRDGPLGGTDLPARTGRRGCGCAGCTPPRTVATWSRWTRGGGCSVACCAGCWCCATTCAPPRGARRRSCTPTTPPPVREGGLTGFGEGNGKCARCNQTKEAPGWRTRVITREVSRDRDRPDGVPRPSPRRSASERAQRVVQVTTPLGHQYESEPPPLLGWGSQSPSWATTWTGADERRAGRSVHRAEPDPGADTDTDGSRGRELARLDAGHEPGPAHRRKRPLRRQRAMRPAPVTRRPRVTSHLERQLCRFLT